MNITRRQFLQVSAASAVATVIPTVSATETEAVVAKKAPTDLSYYFGSETEWNRAGNPGDLPASRDLNNPDNAENIAKLKAEKKATIYSLG